MKNTMSIAALRERARKPEVIASPTHFYGWSGGDLKGAFVLGAPRETKEAALDDAVQAHEWICFSIFAAAHAWREVN